VKWFSSSWRRRRAPAAERLESLLPPLLLPPLPPPPGEPAAARELPAPASDGWPEWNTPLVKEMPLHDDQRRGIETSDFGATNSRAIFSLRSPQEPAL